MQTRNQGFSLFELMIGLSIMSVLVALAVPSFQDYGRSTRVIATQNEVVTALNFARNEAIRRSTPVTVCATSNFTACTASTTWVDGWMAFVDNGGAASAVDAGDEILQSWQGPGNNGVAVAATGPSAAWVQFTATGLANPTTTNKSVLIQSHSCASGELRRLRVTVNGIGAIRNDRVACT